MVTLQAFNVSLSLAAILLASYVTVREQKEKLSRVYEAANLAISAKTEAINVAARELDPALGVLNSYLSILSDGQLGPAPSRWTSALNAMANRAWQVNQIMHELKQAAQIDAHAGSPEHSSVDLRPVLDRAIARAKNRAELVGAQIDFWLDNEPIVVRADPLQVGRIIDNLISNSLTYSIRRPELRVSAAVEGGRAVVRVADNGVGMSETERIDVFRPFHRTEDPALREEPGTGLGLFVSAQLAAANNGTLVLEGTEAGKGSSFALYLPLENKQSRLGNVRSESGT
jgi:signal transduction histidine kinase